MPPARSRLLKLAALAAALSACGSGESPAELSMEYVAHASFRITGESGNTLLLDPFASRVWIGYDFPAELLEADGVVITHPHYDHDYGEFIGRDVPWGEGDRVFREPGDGGELGAFELTGFAGEHAGPYGEEFDKKNTLWLLEHGGLRLLHWGDNAPIGAELAESIGAVDVLLLPVDDLEHLLSFEEVDAAISALDPAIVVPIHYRHADLETSPDSPEDLGGVSEWLESRPRVRRLDAHEETLSRDSLPGERTVYVFEHSPLVVPPE